MSRFANLLKSGVFLVMSKWFYAVRKGKVPGVYSTWPECEKQVKGFNQPVYKKFASQDEAQQFASGQTGSTTSSSAFVPQKLDISSSHLETSELSIAKCRCNNDAASLAFLGSSIQKIMGDLEVIKKELADMKCTVARIDGTFFQAPSLKRAFSTSTRHLADEGAKGKRPKFDHEAEYFTGKKFDASEGVHVYTDGGCFDNGQNGARAGIGVFWQTNDPENASERLPGRPTNNRAEIHAAVRAVQSAKKKGIRNLILHTDSQFLINGITRWIKGWKRNQWIKTTGEPVINKEDFEELDRELKGINVKWVFVKGHTGDPANEAADRLAKQGAEKPI